MCVFAMFELYLLVMVGSRAAMTHIRYLHDIVDDYVLNENHLLPGINYKSMMP